MVKITDIRSFGVHLRFLEPRKYQPQFIEDGDFVMVSDPELNIHAIAEDLPSLLDTLKQQLAATWIEYAKEEDNTLAKSAKLLKQALLSRLKEVTDEPGF